MYRYGYILGFIAREQVCGSYDELRSWFVLPHLRGTGLGDRLFGASVADGSRIYLASTFHPDIANRLERYGFRRISLLTLPFPVLIRYIMKRNAVSVLRHMFVRKSILYIKP